MSSSSKEDSSRRTDDKDDKKSTEEQKGSSEKKSRSIHGSVHAHIEDEEWEEPPTGELWVPEGMKKSGKKSGKE